MWRTCFMNLDSFVDLLTFAACYCDHYPGFHSTTFCICEPSSSMYKPNQQLGKIGVKFECELMRSIHTGMPLILCIYTCLHYFIWLPWNLKAENSQTLSLHSYVMRKDLFGSLFWMKLYDTIISSLFSVIHCNKKRCSLPTMILFDWTTIRERCYMR